MTSTAPWRHVLALILTLAAGLTAWAAPARAQIEQPPGVTVEPVFQRGSSFWAISDQTDVRLISATAATGEAEEIALGLQFALKPGWKVYWRSPGDAGYPPRIDWSGSENLADAVFHWPAPHRFAILGLQTVGYKDEVVLPLTARPEIPGKGMTLRAGLEFLICSDICIPGQANLELAIPSGPAAPSPFAHLIDQWRARVPDDGRGHGVTLERVAVETAADGSRLIAATVDSVVPLKDPDVFVEGPDNLMVVTPEVALSDDRHRAVLRAPVQVGTGPDGALAGLEVTVTVVDGDRGVERRVALVDGGAAPAARAEPAATTTVGALAAMLGIAFLGGLILNLMPCVLPVLSLKVMGLVGHGGSERRHVRMSFVASAAGIIASFVVLAAAAIGVKSAGLAVGWGIQFQQPVFLVVMVVLLTLFAANMWGLFEIVLPDTVNLGGLLEKRGGPDHSHSYGGHFLTGAFATLLATPCSAPFLGTAVGFALSRGTTEILAIFAFLGLGMAAPYLLIALIPGLATMLPRPGAWMVWVRKLLGLALAGTAVWLLTVMVATVGMAGAGLVGAMMAGLVGLLFARPKTPRAARPLVRAATLGLVAGAFAVALIGDGDASRPTDETASATAGAWAPFELAAIATHVAEGRVVFVDVTADWCITCQVNKTVVLEKGEAARLLASDDVVAMRADWTRPSDAIAAYLASFGRYGIPFNAVYGPGAPRGLPLPELLSETDVVAAIAKARGG